MEKSGVELSEELIRIVGESYSETMKLNEENMHPLYLIHGKILEHALGLIDKEKVGNIISYRF